MCTSPALRYWVGKDFELDLFSMGQAVATGRLDEAQITERLKGRYFSLIQFDRGPAEFIDPEDFLDRLLEAVPGIFSTCLSSRTGSVRSFSNHPYSPETTLFYSSACGPSWSKLVAQGVPLPRQLL
jgi:hypothetical protein